MPLPLLAAIPTALGVAASGASLANNLPELLNKFTGGEEKPEEESPI